MRLRFLGTGTSFGVPVVGCGCVVCRSADPRNRRSRHALLLSDGERRLLVDTPPELRLQLLAADVRRLDAVYLSHAHADHLHGIDDLRALTGSGPLPLHAAEEHAAEVRARFPYFLGAERSRQPGTVLPDLDLRPFRDREEIVAGGFRLRTIGFPHGATTSYGFRCGGLAVIIDGKRVPEDAWPLLAGADTLVMNALWRGKPHATHFTVDEAVSVAARCGAARTWLTHLTHRVDHGPLEATLPAAVRLARDGLEIEV
ncbi:MAG: MBL fold metallo-hydrolase [Gemmatimonadota bacterium]|nr:MBL fold metallo-hydrolase [Gemmatimonadota bacterium]